ncbi:uncharacterized protein LOC141819710 [Curcuma longa]|uniref:uncharacterized protein LOC141819710 n=1 Tax=Curcuma longa TaxID=136217 RepID=UPI003D9DF677
MPREGRATSRGRGRGPRGRPRKRGHDDVTADLPEGPSHAAASSSSDPSVGADIPPAATTVPPVIPTPVAPTPAVHVAFQAVPPPAAPTPGYAAVPTPGFPSAPPVAPTPAIPPVPVVDSTCPTDLVAARARIPALAAALKSRFTLFHGGTDPRVAQSWIETVERTFHYTACTEWEKVELAAYHLRDEAEIWWDTQRIMLGEQHITWARFREMFDSQYFPLSYQMTLRQDFQSLRQRGRSVMEYNAEFNRLARCCPELVAEDRSRMLQFTQGLDGHLQVRLAGLGISSYQEVLDRALMIESAHQRAFGDKKKQKKSVQDSAPTQQPQTGGQQHRGRRDFRQGGSGPSGKTQRSGQSSTGRSGFSRQDQRQSGRDSYCARCGAKDHVISACTLEQSVCYYCKLPGHVSRDCSLRAAQRGAPVTSTQGGQASHTGAPRGSQKAHSTHRQQRTAPPAVAAYGIHGQEYSTEHTVSQTSISGPQYQAYAQYPPQPPVQYQTQPQPPVHYQTQPQPSVIYQAQTSYQPPIQYAAPPTYPAQYPTQAQPQQPLAAPPPPPLPETGRIHAVTREEAQRADGSVFRGTILLYAFTADMLVDTGSSHSFISRAFLRRDW